VLYAGFCGPSNPTQSLVADCERCVNLYPEKVEANAAPTGAALYPVPGWQHWSTTTDVGARAIFSTGGRTWAVIGGGFWELYATGEGTRIDAVAQDSYPATISYNGIAGGQLFITSGGNGYCYTLSSGAFAQVLTGDATMGGHLDGRFLAFCRSTGRVRFSNLNDGTTWGSETIYGFLRGQAQDPWQTMLIRPPEIWLIGEQSGEVWYDSGAYPQPFAPISGAFFSTGVAAPFAAGIAGEYVTWLAQGEGGAGRMVAAKSYTPQPISNYAVETSLAGYARTATLADAEVLAYEHQGHQFACFSFPQGGNCWVYDFSLGTWHERQSLNATTGLSGAWRPRVHGYAFGKHLVGERESGWISVLDTTICAEGDGTPIRRVRIPPPLYAKPGSRLRVDRFELLLEAGLGTVSGQGSDPRVALRTSPDTKRWSTERLASAGKLGDYSRRVVWTRLGSSDKLWVPEITMTDPIPWRISGADLIGSGYLQAGG
jgi:hypothetical protein